MRKGVTALQNIQLLKWCTELGVRPYWNVLWGPFRWQEFQRDLTAKPRVPRLVDDAHAAAAKLRGDLIVRDDFPDERIGGRVRRQQGGYNPSTRAEQARVSDRRLFA
jgi:hypothetical protein